MNSSSHSFIVRVWQEVANGKKDREVWRGSIEHVGKEKRLYFGDLRTIVAFVRQEAGWLNQDSHSFLSVRAWRRRILAHK